MSPLNEEELLALWQGQEVSTVRLDPEQLRARALQFESQARRRYLRDQVCWGFLVIVFTFATLTGNGGFLVRLGCGMLVLWSLCCMWGLRRFGSVLPGPAGMSSQSCLEWHRRQLQRQRNIVLSWPLGIGLAAPGFVVYSLGFPLGPLHLPWSVAIALIGTFAFVFLASVIYGKIVAARWQQEFDILGRMRQ